MLLVTNYVAGDNDNEGIDKFAMSNISESQDKLLWVHWISVYLFSGLTFKFLFDVSHEVRRRCTGRTHTAGCGTRDPLTCGQVVVLRVVLIATLVRGGGCRTTPPRPGSCHCLRL